MSTKDYQSSTTKALLAFTEKFGTDFLGRSREQVNTIIHSQLAYLKDSQFNTHYINPRSSINLDTTKVLLHEDRLKAFLDGEKIAPITIDMALTQKCSYACTFCYAGLQQNPSSPADWNVYKSFLNDCVKIGHKPGQGVKAISLVSDGESTESPHFEKFIDHAFNNGINIASGTNGLKLRDCNLRTIAEKLTYLRINFNAAHEEAYCQIMGASSRSLESVLQTTIELVSLKKQLNLPITIGYQMVLMPEYADQVLPLASMARDLGIDYLVIKHCSDDEQGRLGVDYNWYQSEAATELLSVAEQFSTDQYSSQAKWSKIKTGRDRIYSRCYGTPLLLQMSGTGIVAPCGSFFHKDYDNYHIGDIKDTSFFDIWSSDKYDEVIAFLRSEQFDAKKMCATLCLQDKVNEVLYNIIEKDAVYTKPKSTNLPHLNFI
ncbi:radical SAM protein [Synechococcus sp. PROS-U-1]|uniref:radical SAM protein n=1 Tax=Synechococcus sp. PROS-U-1 TaxID=1400866 RepID=UPI0016447237|nr:radical SAM protein [Synechococcus sp. PROS-U-1]QNJ01750.1 radical SAM superfamily protein [Synechococcus sp. PROS-U-1]